MTGLKAVLRNSEDLLAGLLVADLRVILKDPRSKSPEWTLRMFRRCLRAVAGDDA